MDWLEFLNRNALDTYSREYDYSTNYLGDAIFPKEKTRNLFVRIRDLVENGNVPAIAKFSAFDAEAPIGSRENFTEKDYQKLLIKEKLPTSEKASYLLDANLPESDIIKYLFNDANIEFQRVLTRVELANMQVISTGKLTINENNVNTVIDYDLKDSHKLSAFTGWSNPAHSIISDLNQVVALAKAEGRSVTRAVTSSKVIGYMVKNEEIVDTLASVNQIATEKNVLRFILEQFNIDFVANDDTYKVEGGDTTIHRFFPEDKIAFLPSQTFGAGLFAPTPDEVKRVGGNNNADIRQFVYLKAWAEEDPSITWTMGSAVYLPLPLDINALFIATIEA